MNDELTRYRSSLSRSLFSEEFGRHSLSLMGNVDQWVSGCKFPSSGDAAEALQCIRIQQHQLFNVLELKTGTPHSHLKFLGDVKY